MPHLRQLLALICLSTVAAMPARAETGTLWRCWYNRDQHVACVVQQAAAAAPLSPSQQAVLAATPGITRSAVLPPAVVWLRERPGALRGRTMMIPLYGEPIDHAFVAELARSVMCGPLPQCQVHYSEDPAGQPLDAAAFADANDPLLTPGE